jgi:uncharacterized protein with ParB-like and HNH nuclease domain
MTNSRVEINPYKFSSSVFSLDRLIMGGVANDLGLLIPDFQRDYTWEDKDITRLFDDLLLGFSTRSKHSSGHFFGATVWNLRTRAKLETEFILPSYDIVDGQQRITTCLLLLISLHFKIRTTQKQIEDEAVLPSSLLAWLKNESIYIQRSIRQIIIGDINRGTHPYPRIIHEEDVRGSSESTSDYKSPLSKILIAVGTAIDEEKFEVDYKNIKVTKDQENVHQRLIDNINLFEEYIEQINKKEFFQEFNIPFVEKKFLGRKLFIELFNMDPNKSEFDSSLNINELFEKQIRLIQFFGYFYKATCFTIITCENEDAAFSIFDSLNTTGVPLTAIETLKPYVMRDYRDSKEKFELSEACTNFRYVEKIIRSLENSSERQSNISKEIAIHSALLGGKKQILTNNLTSQRIGLRYLHTKCQTNGNIDLSSTLLSKVTCFREDFSFIENIRKISEPSLSSKEEDEIKLCMAFLANTKTRLYIPLLTRFHWNETNRKLFHKACKAITAFYVLRRSTTVTTDRIDTIFRSCMVGTETFNGFELNYEKPQPLKEADLQNLKNHLKSNLKSNFEFTLSDKNKWIDHVKSMTHYRGAKSLLRFMLFVAHDGAKIDPTDTTLIQRSDASPDSSTEFLSFSMWDKDIYETLEHVAPQNERSLGWKGVYEDPKLKDTIGNFVLLPKGQNSSLSDSSWPTKKLFFNILLEDSITERKKLINNAESKGINLPKSIKSSVISPTGLIKSHMLAGLDNVTEWNKKFIENRSSRLCELVWDRMKEWLD